MFQVESKNDGRIYTVYGMSGGLFLIWNDALELPRWEWVDMNMVQPVMPHKTIRQEREITNSTGQLLHNQNCPYDYKCRAVDCIECMEIYGKTGGGEC